MGFLIDGKPLEYTTLVGQEMGGSDYFGIKIQVGGTNMPDLKGEDAFAFRTAARKAIDNLTDEYNRLKNKNDPKIARQTERNRNEIIDQIFSFHNTGFSFVEEIPNGYCSEQCCEHLPWFIVTTVVGRFKVGWRKRVISINWDGFPNPQDAKELFNEEDTTNYDHCIHAWSIEDAIKYVKKIMEAHQ